MTDFETDDFTDLERAVSAIQSQSAMELPPEELVVSTVETLESNRSATITPTPRSNRRETMIRLARLGTLGTAASILIALCGSILIQGVGSQPAFAQVVQSMGEARTASYTLVQKLGNQPALTCESAFADGFIRTEIAGQIIFIANVRTGETLQLVPSQKLATQGKADQHGAGAAPTIADVMKEMTEDQGTYIETIKQSDGTKVDLYRISQLPAFMGAGKIADDDVFHVWVDPQTNLPTRIKLRTKTGPQNTSIEMEFSNFHWNVAFPEDYFSMKLPEGYQLQPATNGN